MISEIVLCISPDMGINNNNTCLCMHWLCIGGLNMCNKDVMQHGCNVVYAFHQQNSTDGKVNKSQVSDLKYVDQSARPKLVI